MCGCGSSFWVAQVVTVAGVLVGGLLCCVDENQFRDLFSPRDGIRQAEHGMEGFLARQAPLVDCPPPPSAFLLLPTPFLFILVTAHPLPLHSCYYPPTPSLFIPIIAHPLPLHFWFLTLSPCPVRQCRWRRPTSTSTRHDTSSRTFGSIWTWTRRCRSRPRCPLPRPGRTGGTETGTETSCRRRRPATRRWPPARACRSCGPWARHTPLTSLMKATAALRQRSSLVSVVGAPFAPPSLV